MTNSTREKLTDLPLAEMIDRLNQRTTAAVSNIRRAIRRRSQIDTTDLEVVLTAAAAAVDMMNQLRKVTN